MRVLVLRYRKIEILESQNVKCDMPEILVALVSKFDFAAS